MKKSIFFIFLLLFLFSCSKKLDKKSLNVNNFNNMVITNHNKLNIAILVPLSGPLKKVGESIVNSAQLSLFENDKKNIVLKLYDTKGTTFGATSAMNRAIYDGIDVVIGPLLPDEVKSIKNIAKKNNILLFSLTSDQNLRNIDNIFITGFIPEQEIQTLVSYFKKNDIFNYVALMPNNDYGAITNKVLRTTVLGKDGLLIKTDYYNENEKKLTGKINDLINFYEIPQTLYEEYQKKKQEQKLLGSKEEIQFIINEQDKIYPQALFIAEGGKTAELIANLLFIVERNKEDKITLIGTSKIDGDENLLLNPYLNNIIFVGADPVKYNKFSNDYYDIYKKTPIKIGSIVYDLVKIMDKIFIQNENNEFVPNKIELLNPLGFDGIDGKYRFLPNGIVERNLYILQLQNKEKIILNESSEFLNY